VPSLVSTLPAVPALERPVSGNPVALESVIVGPTLSTALPVPVTPVNAVLGSFQAVPFQVQVLVPEV